MPFDALSKIFKYSNFLHIFRQHEEREMAYRHYSKQTENILGGLKHNQIKISTDLTQPAVTSTESSQEF